MEKCLSYEQWEHVLDSWTDEEYEKKLEAARADPQGGPVHDFIADGIRNKKRRDESLRLKEEKHRLKRAQEFEAKVKRHKLLAEKSKTGKPFVGTFKPKSEPTLRELIIEIKKLLTRPKPKLVFKEN